MSTIDLIKSCPMFYELYDAEIEQIVGSCNVESYDDGDKIITQGEEGTEIFVILYGETQIVLNTPAGDKEVMRLVKGDVFGELVLINQTLRTANVVCKGKVDVLVINDEAIYELFKSKTKVFAVLALNLARLLTKRLQKANQIIEELKSA